MELDPNQTRGPGKNKPPTGRARDRKAYGRTRIANGSAWLTNADQRTLWYRRFKDCINDHLSDIPDASASERSILRRASVLEVELERLETRFANDGSASDSDLDLYQRTASTMRRLLEAIGLQRRPRDITPSLDQYLAGKHVEAAE
jgi:hypothetical protein